MGLPELKAKWFLPFASGTPPLVPPFPPPIRHPGTAVSNSTDGNLVETLIDGERYMQLWHNEIERLWTLGRINPEVYHAGWRFEGVQTLGETHTPREDALDTIRAAFIGGVTPYVLMSGHAPLGLPYNRPTNSWLRWVAGIMTASTDYRFPAAGSNHPKATCIKHAGGGIALVGSIDVSKSRWDTDAHAHGDLNRAPNNGPTHDTAVKIQGPAVADIERSFIERWNDPSRDVVYNVLPRPIAGPITSPVTGPTPFGTHSVQVLHTYGRTPTVGGVNLYGYTWSPVGEFTLWASHLNALAQASNYIYIEDQYFWPAGWPPDYLGGAGPVAQASDLVYQLGRALQRGVNVAVVVPLASEDAFYASPANQKYQRDIALNYLSSLVTPSTGAFTVASLSNGSEEIYVHSKLMIVDDEFVSIGSGNFAQRSMTHDGELHLGIVDAAETFARDFRKEVWQEHSGHAIADDPVVAFGQFVDDVTFSVGRLRPVPTTHPGPTPPRGNTYHERMINGFLNPYAGPPR